MNRLLKEELSQMKAMMGINEYTNSNPSEFYHGSPHRFESFDIKKVGSSEGIAKYGHGIYFTISKEAAVYYASEHALSRDPIDYYIYTVRLPDSSTFRQWEEPIDPYFQDQVIEALIDLGLDEDAESIRNESGDHGYEYWTMRELYEYLQYTLDGPKATSEFLVDLNVCGVIAIGSHAGLHDDTIYNSFTGDAKIINVETHTKNANTN